MCLPVSVDLYGQARTVVCMCALCACAYWEYMLSLTAGGTWGVELQQSCLTQPVGAGTTYFPLAGTSLEDT